MTYRNESIDNDSMPTKQENDEPSVRVPYEPQGSEASNSPNENAQSNTDSTSNSHINCPDSPDPDSQVNSPTKDITAHESLHDVSQSLAEEILLEEHMDIQSPEKDHRTEASCESITNQNA